LIHFQFCLELSIFAGQTLHLKTFQELTSQTTDRMKEQKHSICYMILPEGIREDLAEGLKALSEKHAKDKRMATVEERSVAAAQILKSKTNAAVSFENQCSKCDYRHDQDPPVISYRHQRHWNGFVWPRQTLFETERPPSHSGKSAAVVCPNRWRGRLLAWHAPFPP